MCPSFIFRKLCIAYKGKHDYGDDDVYNNNGLLCIASPGLTTQFVNVTIRLKIRDCSAVTVTVPIFFRNNP